MYILIRVYESGEVIKNSAYKYTENEIEELSVIANYCNNSNPVGVELCIAYIEE